MLDDIRELNEAFYELYGRLYENVLFLPSKQRDYTYQVLLSEYKAEYARISSENEIERLTESFSVKLRRKALVPKRWWLFRKKNRAAQLIEDEVRAAIEAYFAAKEAEIAETLRKMFAKQAQDADENDGKEEAREAAETVENGATEAAETPAIDVLEVLRNARTAEQVRRSMEEAEKAAETAETPAEQAQGDKANDGTEEAEEAAETAENGAEGAAISL